MLNQTLSPDAPGASGTHLPGPHPQHDPRAAISHLTAPHPRLELAARLANPLAR